MMKAVGDVGLVKLTAFWKTRLHGAEAEIAGGGVFSSSPERQRGLRVDREGGGVEPRGSPLTSPLTTTEGPSLSQGGGALSKKQRGEGPPGNYTSVVMLGLSLRGTAALIEALLATSVHPNPGPGTRRGRRGRGEEHRRGRRERRNLRRRERASARREGRGSGLVGGARVREGGCEIVTWNVQGMSVRESNRERMRRVVDRVIREGWEVVCMTELRADSEGVVWLGEEECRVAVVHGRKSGVLLRGGALEAWVREGQSKWVSERVTGVVFFRE